MPRRRADDTVVAQGLASSVDEARRLIMAGEISLPGARIEKPGDLLPQDAKLHCRKRRTYASRGGLKLERALEEFQVDVAGVAALDAGSSTGGFTDCLLRAGARLVYSVDVGYGQLAWALRNDPRVVVMERTNIRDVNRASLDPPPDLVVADLSFVSLRSVLPSLLALADPETKFIVLVKPQFEVDRAFLRRGIVDDPSVREQAVADVEALATKLGFFVRGRVESPIKGADGNCEYLLALDPKA